MKFNNKFFIVLMAFVTTLVFAQNASAGIFNNGDELDKVTVKTREAVNHASPDDWKTYAESAEKCIKKKVNLKEAAAWIDKSLEIKETPYNLRVKGDYYRLNNLPEKAIEYYVKSLTLGKTNDVNYNDTDTQTKIMELRK